MRILDFSASLLGLLVFFPLLLFIALAVKLSSAGPVLYRGRRVGEAGRIFYLYKFRTMVVDADRRGPGVTGHNDRRVTRLGKLLRSTKVDELPQLLNVLKGDMSLVGPRPEDPRYVKAYTPEQRQVLRVKPGITSPATLAYRCEERLLSGLNSEATYRQEILPAKLEIELSYSMKRNAWTDLEVIYRTCGILLWEIITSAKRRSFPGAEPDEPVNAAPRRTG